MSSVLETKTEVETKPELEASLFVAVRNNDPKEVEYLLSTFPVSIHCKDKDGNSPLHIACGYGTIEMVEFFIKKGAKLHDESNRNEDFYTPFLYAISKHNHEVIIYLEWTYPELTKQTIGYETSCKAAARAGNLFALRRYDPDDIIKTKDFGGTPFLEAARGGSIPAMEFILRIHPKALQDRNGSYTPIIAAIESGNMDALKWLHEKDPNLIKIRPERGFGWSPMKKAASENNIAAMRFIVQKDPDALKEERTHDDPAIKNAATIGSIEAIEFLLLKDPELSANPTQYFKWIDGFICNMKYARGDDFEKRSKGIIYILRKFPQLIRYRGDGAYDCTPFTRAASLGFIPILEVILSLDPNCINVPDDDMFRRTAMYSALSSRDNWPTKLKAAKYLMTKGAKIGQMDNDWNHTEEFRFIDEAYNLFNVVEKGYLKYLQEEWVNKGYPIQFKRIAEKKPELSAAQVSARQGDTLLHAAMRGSWERDTGDNGIICCYLIDQGLSLHSKNDAGDTPLQVAFKEKNYETIVTVFKYLKKKILEKKESILEEHSKLVVLYQEFMDLVQYAEDNHLNPSYHILSTFYIQCWLIKAKALTPAIATPEKGSELYENALLSMSHLIYNKRVEITKDGYMIPFSAFGLEESEFNRYKRLTFALQLAIDSKCYDFALLVAQEMTDTRFEMSRTGLESFILKFVQSLYKSMNKPKEKQELKETTEADVKSAAAYASAAKKKDINKQKKSFFNFLGEPQSFPETSYDDDFFSKETLLQRTLRLQGIEPLVEMFENMAMKINRNPKMEEKEKEERILNLKSEFDELLEYGEKNEIEIDYEYLAVNVDKKYWAILAKKLADHKLSVKDSLVLDTAMAGKPIIFRDYLDAFSADLRKKDKKQKLSFMIYSKIVTVKESKEGEHIKKGELSFEVPETKERIEGKDEADYIKRIYRTKESIQSELSEESNEERYNRLSWALKFALEARDFTTAMQITSEMTRPRSCATLGNLAEDLNEARSCGPKIEDFAMRLITYHYKSKPTVRDLNTTVSIFVPLQAATQTFRQTDVKPLDEEEPGSGMGLG